MTEGTQCFIQIVTCPEKDKGTMVYIKRKKHPTEVAAGLGEKVISAKVQNADGCKVAASLSKWKSTKCTELHINPVIKSQQQ